MSLLFMIAKLHDNSNAHDITNYEYVFYPMGIIFALLCKDMHILIFIIDLIFESVFFHKNMRVKKVFLHEVDTYTLGIKKQWFQS